RRGRGPLRGAGNPAEAVWAGLYAAVLEGERVRVEEHISESGGHRLQARQMVARERSAFAGELPVRGVVEVATVRGSAEAVERLRESLRLLVRRHEALRTRIVLAAGHPEQWVGAEPVEWELPLADLRSAAPGEAEARARRMVEEEVRRPFDLQGEWSVRNR